MLIVVSGHSRGVGKTSLVEAILRASPRCQFSTLKISGHRHGASEALLQSRKDSGPRGNRLLAAGAQSVWLLGAGNESFQLALSAIDDLLSSSPNWIVESNRLVAYRRPDLLFFVWHPEKRDWKASSDVCLAACDAVVLRGSACAGEIEGRTIPERARRLLQPLPGVLTKESSHWLAGLLSAMVEPRPGIDLAETTDPCFVS